jgi:uncharacterized protein (TIRG00374 family)
MNKRLQTIFQYVFLFGLGIFFTWLSLKNLNREKIGQIRLALQHARHWIIVPVFIMLVMSHYIRALRWKLLIEPLGYNPSNWHCFFAVMIGYLTNQGVPRLGEVLKCTILGRNEKIPPEKLIGTIILERIIDAVTFLSVFGFTLLIQPHLLGNLRDSIMHAPADTTNKGVSGKTVLFVILGAFILFSFLWMLIKKKKWRDIVNILRRIWRSVVQGLLTIKFLKKRKRFIIYTFLIWSLYLFSGYLGFMAFRETSQYGITEAFAILSTGSLGLIVSPGGIGAYAYLIQQTMMLYGLGEAIALAFGWILWLAQTLIIVVGGLISFVAIPVHNKRKFPEKA